MGGRDLARELAALDEALRLEVQAQNWEAEHTVVVATRPRLSDATPPGPGIRKPGRSI